MVPLQLACRGAEVCGRAGRVGLLSVPRFSQNVGKDSLGSNAAWRVRNASGLAAFTPQTRSFSQSWRRLDRDKYDKKDKYEKYDKHDKHDKHNKKDKSDRYDKYEKYDKHDKKDKNGEWSSQHHDSQKTGRIDNFEAATKQQIRRPWQREGADRPPVDQEARNLNKSMEKGRLLTTPTRLLKLILPLPADATHDEKGNKGEFRSLAQNEDIQPLALLMHPQQPLSYLERLIQAEIPPVYDSDGREKMPSVYFRAEGSDRDASGALRKDSKSKNIASASGLGREGPDTPSDSKDWVRWSSSTEIGDFIRDAARGREFAIDITGHEAELRISVPSFDDRTHYMRLRLRRMSRNINRLAHLKDECDTLAQRGAHRLAKLGFAVLSGWWGVVYFVTFHTDAGWDLVEPVTYLAGLTTIMGGYLWFLFISKDLSYRAALNLTVTRRQNVLYQERGFDLEQWQSLALDANQLRKEIRTIAEEYDVEYDEARDLGSEEVMEALDHEREKEEKKGRSKEDGEEEKKKGGSDNGRKNGKEGKGE